MHQHPVRLTARMILHLPPADAALAHWSFMLIETRNGHPRGDFIARGAIPFPGDPRHDFRLWEALDRIVEQHVIA